VGLNVSQKGRGFPLLWTARPLFQNLKPGRQVAVHSSHDFKVVFQSARAVVRECRGHFSKARARHVFGCNHTKYSQQTWFLNLQGLANLRRRLPRWFVSSTPKRARTRPPPEAPNGCKGGLAHLFHLLPRSDLGKLGLCLAAFLSWSLIAARSVPYRHVPPVSFGWG